MDRNSRQEFANSIRNRIEKYVREGDSLFDALEGSIYGKDSDGNYIIGYGVDGSLNITLSTECVAFGGVESEPFSDETSSAIKEFKDSLENC